MSCLIGHVIVLLVVLLLHHVLSNKLKYNVFITDWNDGLNFESKAQVENILSRFEVLKQSCMVCKCQYSAHPSNMTNPENAWCTILSYCSIEELNSKKTRGQAWKCTSANIKIKLFNHLSAHDV